jgi:hypothetical protein
MNLVGKSLAKRGFRLRTGDAVGADSAFLMGALEGLEGKDRKEILKLIEAYVPYTKKGRLADYHIRPRPDQLAELERILKATHPKPEALYGYGRELMARNALQLLGRDLNDPSDFLIGMLKPKHLRVKEWDVGGTGQAFRLAKERDIPIFDLAGSKGELETALGKYAQKGGPALEALTRMVERLLGSSVSVPAVKPGQPREMVTGEAARAKLQQQAPKANPLRSLPMEELLRQIREGQ